MFYYKTYSITNKYTYLIHFISGYPIRIKIKQKWGYLVFLKYYNYNKRLTDETWMGYRCWNRIKDQRLDETVLKVRLRTLMN
jgi:hypothetical protein